MEVKMKKIAALLLALVMVIGLAACGTTSNNTGNTTPAGNNGNAAPAAELGFPKEVTIYIPQAVNNMLDRSGRIMYAYWQKLFPDVKFTVENADGNGNDHARIVATSQDANDLSVIMFHGAGAIVQYYSGDWDYNLADQKLFKAVCGNIGQEQPSGAVTLINANETRFTSIPELIDYIKANPGKVRISYTTGTPHEVRIKLILNYFGVKKEDVQWNPGSANDIRAWIQGGNTDVAIITETQAAQDITGGKVKGILNSVANRNLYTSDLAPLKDVPIVPEIAGIKAEDVEGLVCAWPMTIYVPASVPDELCEWLAAKCATIRDDADFMKQIKALGSTNTFQIFSLKEINDIQQEADQQIQEVFKAFEGWTAK
jgi:tripartite-type tricarboxylate transporter receptor subunit TctC